MRGPRRALLVLVAASVLGASACGHYGRPVRSAPTAPVPEPSAEESAPADQPDHAESSEKR